MHFLALATAQLVNACAHTTHVMSCQQHTRVPPHHATARKQHCYVRHALKGALRCQVGNASPTTHMHEVSTSQAENQKPAPISWPCIAASVRIIPPLATHCHFVINRQSIHPATTAMSHPTNYTCMSNVTPMARQPNFPSRFLLSYLTASVSWLMRRSVRRRTARPHTPCTACRTLSDGILETTHGGTLSLQWFNRRPPGGGRQRPLHCCLHNSLSQFTVLANGLRTRGPLSRVHGV